VRKVDTNTWECTACGARVTVARGGRPVALLLTLHGRPRERVVTVREEIVHRCVYGDGPDASD